jgi:hypothetical protein
MTTVNAACQENLACHGFISPGLGNNVDSGMKLCLSDSLLGLWSGSKWHTHVTCPQHFIINNK